MKNSLNRTLRIASFALLILAVISCNDNRLEPEEKLSDAAVLMNIGFTMSNNPSMANSVHSHPNGNLHYISVPEGIDLKTLKPTFYVSKGAKVYISGIEVIEGTTSCDFSKFVEVEVVSESENVTRKYTIFAKNGDPVVDGKVYIFMADYSIPGVSLSVMKDEEIIYSSGYGFAIEENRVKTTPDHLFRLASVSKQFTTLCIMTLYERGLINLEKNVFGKGGYLDEQFPGVTGQKATVTIRNLLQHNSGWPTDPDPMFTNSIRNGKSLDDLINYILQQDLENSPGEKYSYYNMGFGILGRVVEVVSGKPYEEFLKEEVLKPMGITDIHVGGGENERRDNECVYYSQDGTNGYGNPMKVIAAAGGIIASTPQLMKVLAHIDGREGVPDILKPETLEVMYNSPSANYSRYSLGWRIGHSLFPGAHYHSGNLAGTTAIWAGNTNIGLSAALLANSRSYISGYDDAYYILLGDILTYYTGKYER